MTEFKVKKLGKKLRKKVEKATAHTPTHTPTETTEGTPQQELFKKPAHTRRIRKHGANISIIISTAIIVILCIAIIKIVMSIDFRALLLAAGEDLAVDKNDRTNFLVIGTGNKDHDGADLTDTIIVASLDQEKETISMVSIPRDLYIDDGLLNSIRVNEVYFYAKKHFESSALGLDYFKEQIEEISNLEIQYYIKIDFDGFEKIIDELGGIEIDVPEAIYDPYYPIAGSIYTETFSVSKGLQYMDGEDALKYARSRKTSSDFDRSKRQQLIIHAIKDKALQTKIVLNKDKLTSLLEIIKDNIETNLKAREMITLGAIASDYDRDQITDHLLHDDPVQCGGFMYAPPPSQYGGAFVLTPAGGDEQIHRYFDLVTGHTLALQENLEIQVLNGTPRQGIAAENKQVFQRYCFNITRFGNARSQDITQTTIYYNPLPLPKDDPADETQYYRPHTLDALKFLIPEAIESTEFPKDYTDLGYNKSSDIIIEIGSDYVNSDNYIEDSFWPLYSIIYAPRGTEEADTDETSPAATTTEPNE